MNEKIAIDLKNAMQSGDKFTLSVLMINNYKQTFLNALKNDIKEELYQKELEKKPIYSEEIVE